MEIRSSTTLLHAHCDNSTCQHVEEAQTSTQSMQRRGGGGLTWRSRTEADDGAVPPATVMEGQSAVPTSPPPRRLSNRQTAHHCHPWSPTILQMSKGRLGWAETSAGKCGAPSWRTNLPILTRPSPPLHPAPSPATSKKCRMTQKRSGTGRPAHSSWRCRCCTPAQCDAPS